MTDYFSLTPTQQRTIIDQIQNRLGLPAQAVEKDMWVTTLLQILFSLDLDANILFKGGTSLSKIGNLIERFSEDIDIAIDPAKYGMSGDLTKKQLKSLRKRSSLYVKEVLAPTIQKGLDKYGLSDILTIEVEHDGVGDATYPEPRRIFIKYPSLLDARYGYLKNEVVLEVGARSLMEPTIACQITSMIESSLPTISTSLVNPEIVTAAPAKTFVEKACLLHELFSIERDTIVANRRSRHLYDLERLMDTDYADSALHDLALYGNIVEHRRKFYHVGGVDYSLDMPDKIAFCPSGDILNRLRSDYDNMRASFIYGQPLDFDNLIKRIQELQLRFRTVLNR